jgi:signal transduction histidine kinase
MTATPARFSGLYLGWAFTVIMAGALSAGAFAAYWFIKTGYEEQLERRLKSYASTAAGSLNPDGLELIVGNDDELSRLYLRRISNMKRASGVRRAAVLTREGKLVLDTEEGEFAARDYGFANDSNELETCFTQGPTVTIIYTDENGRTYRNAFAPVLYDDGTPSNFAVAVELEADYTARLRDVRNTMAVTVICVFVVTLISALLLARAWKRMQKQLAAQTRLAEQAQFSAGMAHQIKNPLAALRGYVELLARGLSEPMHKQLADKLVSEVGALDRVVRDFLQFSRGAHGSIERLTLEQALRPVLDAARTAGGEKVAIATPTLPPIEVEVDSTALREALNNVCINAAEAMREEGGTLTLRASAIGDTITLEVEDTGPGLPDDVKAKLFQPFVTGKADGTGLGLPIARRLLRDMGGNLELIRTGASGTMFRASFLKESKA